MKNTKKGVKRNPVLVLAVLGLLVGAGATGAIAAGLVPNLDTGVNGTVTATVTDSPLLTISDVPALNDGTFTGFTSAGGDTVKFSENLAIAAPGFANVSVNVTVNRIVENANGLLISMTGLGDYVKVVMIADATSTPNSTVATSLGNGEWIVQNGIASDLAVGNSMVLVFTIYVTQANNGYISTLDNVWNFEITEVKV